MEYWLQDERDTININESSGWVIFNVQSAGELIKKRGSSRNHRKEEFFIVLFEIISNNFFQTI